MRPSQPLEKADWLTNRTKCGLQTKDIEVAAAGPFFFLSVTSSAAGWILPSDQCNFCNFFEK